MITKFDKISATTAFKEPYRNFVQNLTRADHFSSRHAQPIIIKKSSKQPNPNSSSMPIPFNKETQKSRATKQQTISTAVRRPQLTNYALN